MEDLFLKGNSPQEQKTPKLITDELIEEFRDLSENAPLPLHWVNNEGVIIWANRSQLDILGYSSGEFFNKHISYFYTDSDAASDIALRLQRKEMLVNYSARIRSKNGHIRHILINTNACIRNGVFQYTRCYTTDITELKNEELKTKRAIAKLQDINTRLLWKTSDLRMSDKIMKILVRPSH